MIANQSTEIVFKSIYISSLDRLYLQKAMKAVSRSFALVTPCFEEPFDAVMSTAYLIFRVADNREDCFYSDSEKEDLYENLHNLIHHENLTEEIYKSWSQLDWPGLTSEERQLMQIEGGVKLWEIFFSLPDVGQASIAHWLQEMIVGTLELAELDNNKFVLIENIKILQQDNSRSIFLTFPQPLIN